jgi:hypothetical protein
VVHCHRQKAGLATEDWDLAKTQAMFDPID